MRSRTRDMWFAAALEAPDPAALAAFYSQLLGWPVVEETPGTVIVAAPPETSFTLVFHLADDYVAPVWPPVQGAQRPMMHLDFQVGDLEAAVADAVGLGATEAGHQPQDHVRVMIDPVGHPFCLCRTDD